MKPIRLSVLAICLAIATATPHNIQEMKTLPDKPQPLLEAEESATQVRVERCSSCGVTIGLDAPLAAIQALPGAEIHTQSSFEGCSSEKGCAGIKVKDGKVVQRFGDVNAFKAAADADSGNEFSFHAAGANAQPFWWQGENSPFKGAAAGGGQSFEKFSKSSSSSFSSGGGNAGFGANGGGAAFGAGIDLSANPFLNGDFSKLSSGFNANGNGANGNAQLAGKPAGSYQSSFESSSFSTASKGGDIDLAKNPFLNGGFKNQAQFGASQGYSSNGNKFTGYTGSSPSPFTASTGSNVNLIQSSQKASEFDYEQQNQQNIDEIFQETGNVHAHEHGGGELQQTCAGQGYVCVHKAQCNNGVVNTNGASVLQAKTKKQYCNIKTEICCRIEIQTLQGASGLQGSLGVGGATFTGQGSQGSQGSQGTGLFVSTSQSSFGQESSGSASRGQGGQFGQEGSASAARGQAGQSFGQESSGSRGTSSFGQESSSSRGSFGQDSFGSASRGSGSFGQDANAAGQRGNNQGFGSTQSSFESSSSSFEQNNRGFGAGQVGQGQAGQAGQAAQGSQSGSGFNAQGTASFGQAGIGFQAGQGQGQGQAGFGQTGSGNAFESSSSTFESSSSSNNFGGNNFGQGVAGQGVAGQGVAGQGVASQAGAGFGQAGTNFGQAGSKFGGSTFNTENEITKTQTNFVETDTFSSGSESSGVFKGSNRPGIPYLPPDNSNSGSNTVSTSTFSTTTRRPYVPPSTGAPGYLPPDGEQTINTETRIPGPAPQPNYNDGELILDDTRRPTPPPANTEIPSGCAAALKCTPIEFCTADGVMSNTSVALTRDQEAFRVPLTDCKDLESGRVGKCCRDPNYSDPWPTNLIGKWTAGVFGGNDGKYTPDNRGSPNNPRAAVTGRPPVTRAEPITGNAVFNNFRSTKPPVSPITSFPSTSPSPQTFGQKGPSGPGNLGQFAQGGKGQFAQGSRGQFAQGSQATAQTSFGGSQGQIGFGQQGQQGQRGQGSQGQFGAGQTSFTETSFSETQNFGQKTQGQGINQGQGVRQGQGQVVSQGQGQIASQGQGQFVSQGQGQIVSQAQGQFGFGGRGQAGSQGQGQLEIQEQQGFAQRGQSQSANRGQGQAFSQGQGQFVSQGQGQTATRGQGIAVSQGAGAQENEYSESVQRVFLQRYNAGGQCGVFNGQKPYGNRNDFEVDFAEIPWQAMVLLQTNKSLLCGGVITRPDVVITSASCVDGLDARNVLIKGGEWKLGIDEEPLPFQIVQVKNILKHPFYRSGGYAYDVAILVLTENLRLAKNIYPICLPGSGETLDAFYNGAGECIVTGWGKQVLQAHLSGSIMHSVNISLVNPGECQARLQQEFPQLQQQYDAESCACGQPTNPISNICRVDTGSALACTTGDGHFVLRGVYSWDSGCQAGNQLAAFYKFDLEWYEWAIGLIESTRFVQFGSQSGSRYTGQVNSGIKGIRGAQGQGIRAGVKGGSATASANFGIKGQVGLGGLGGFGQFSKFTQASEANTGLGQIKPLENSNTYYSFSEKKVYQSEPQIVTYTTKPEIFTYTTKPKIVTFTTKPQFITYETAGSGSNPQFVAPGVTLNPGFSSIIPAKHIHGPACKCLDQGK